MWMIENMEAMREARSSAAFDDTEDITRAVLTAGSNMIADRSRARELTSMSSTTKGHLSVGDVHLVLQQPPCGGHRLGEAEAHLRMGCAMSSGKSPAMLQTVTASLRIPDASGPYKGQASKP